MRYRVLGPLEVQDGPRTVPLPQRRQRLLIAVLLLHANEVVSRDRLIDALWGEAPPPTAANSMHNVVSGVRKALGNGALVTRDGGYVLHVAAGELDAERFAELARQGSAAHSRGDPESAARLLREALGLWRGPPFADLAFHPALADEAARLEEARLVALEERIGADLARGHHADVVADLDALVSQHPLRERLRAHLMLALYRCGRQADALASYRDGRERLVEELGIEPGPALRRLEQAVLEQDSQLGAPDALPASPPAVAWARRHAGALIVAGAVALATAVVALVASGGSEPPPRAAVAATRDYLAAIDLATDRIVRRYPVGDTPAAVAVGAGAAWSVNADGGTVSRVDLRSGAVKTARISTSMPLDIAATTDAAWVVGTRDNPYSAPPPGVLVRLDAAGAPVADLQLPPADGPSIRGGPQLVAAGGGAVWAIGRTGRLQRVDPGTGHAREVRGFRALKVAAGGGQVWVLAETPPYRPDAPALLRLEPRTGSVVASVEAPSRSLGMLAVGAGAVWVTDGFTGAVWRIDPDGRSAPRPIPVGQGIDSIAAGDGAVWVANSLAGTVARIDPALNEVVKEIGLGATPRSITIAEGRVWVTGAGAGSNAEAAGSLRDGARVKPITSRDCTPVLTGADGDPDFLIVYDDVFEGNWLSAIESVHDAIAFVLREHRFRAGRFRIGLQRCNNGVAQTGFPDEAKCQANARAYARNPSVLGVLGPSHSVCTAAMLPALNSAPGGPVAVVSQANSHVALVRSDPLAPAGLLAELYPTGQRGYARIHPSDDYEVAAAALFARQLSPGGVFLVTDHFADEGPLPIYFRRAARRISLPIVGHATLGAEAGGSRRLAERIRASGAGAVYTQAGINDFLRRLRPALGPDLAVISAASGGLPLARLFESAGDEAARGVYVTIAGQPVERLGPAGRRFVRDFSATRRGRVPTWAVYGAAAAEVLLNAIARSDGTRESVSRALVTVDLPDSPVGPIAFDRHGEPVTNPVAIVRADHGGEPDDGVITAGAEVIDVIVPPARLVGELPGQ